MSDYGYRAKVEDDFLMNGVRLQVGLRRPEGMDIFMPDGTWISIPERQELPTHGIVLPFNSVDAVAAAFGKYLGNALPSQAEVKVLREVLEVERDRVNEVLFAHREAFERRTQ